MYDRATESLWNQFTGEPVIGPLADSGIVLPFFPSELTTWQEWVARHPDTTVISPDTGLYSPAFYTPESDPSSIYYNFRKSPKAMFPVWNREDALALKQVVLGVGVDGAYKAYPVDRTQAERVINDAVGAVNVVVLGSAESEAARAYERGARTFALESDDEAPGLPAVLVDGSGALGGDGGGAGQRVRRLDAAAGPDTHVVLARLVLVPPGHRGVRTGVTAGALPRMRDLEAVECRRC